MTKTVVKVGSLAGTRGIAEKIAEKCKGGEVICLIGDLGAGKTNFTKFFAQAFGIQADEVVSPTFMYLRQYQGEKFVLNHFDFYRIDDPSEVIDLAFEETIDVPGTVTIIEWADRVEEYLPSNRLEIQIKILEKDERKFTLKLIGKELDYLL